MTQVKLLPNIIDGVDVWVILIESALKGEASTITSFGPAGVVAAAIATLRLYTTYTCKC